ncbi:MAG: hypothetical protein KGI89_17280 [Euryarchaeota archaeon]|nr:hypothetical protein [Euryarchaeota archaeon]
MTDTEAARLRTFWGHVVELAEESPLTVTADGETIEVTWLCPHNQRVRLHALRADVLEGAVTLREIVKKARAQCRYREVV